MAVSGWPCRSAAMSASRTRSLAPSALVGDRASASSNSTRALSRPPPLPTLDRAATDEQRKRARASVLPVPAALRREGRRVRKEDELGPLLLRPTAKARPPLAARRVRARQPTMADRLTRAPASASAPSALPIGRRRSTRETGTARTRVALQPSLAPSQPPLQACARPEPSPADGAGQAHSPLRQTPTCRPRALHPARRRAQSSKKRPCRRARYPRTTATKTGAPPANLFQRRRSAAPPSPRLRPATVRLRPAHRRVLLLLLLLVAVRRGGLVRRLVVPVSAARRDAGADCCWRAKRASARKGGMSAAEQSSDGRGGAGRSGRTHRGAGAGSSAAGRRWVRWRSRRCSS